MEDQLKKSIEHLLSLKEDWDDEGAKSFEQETIDKALNYIPKIEKTIKELWNLDLRVKYFNPVPDGSIDIELRNDKKDYHLLFNIPQGNDLPTFSGESKGIKYADYLK